MKLLRHVLSLPFAILAVLVFYVADFISGQTYTFRSKQVIEKFKKSLVLTCSECGHTKNGL